MRHFAAARMSQRSADARSTAGSHENVLEPRSRSCESRSPRGRTHARGRRLGRGSSGASAPQSPRRLVTPGCRSAAWSVPVAPVSSRTSWSVISRFWRCSHDPDDQPHAQRPGVHALVEPHVHRDVTVGRRLRMISRRHDVHPARPGIRRRSRLPAAGEVTPGEAEREDRESTRRRPGSVRWCCASLLPPSPFAARRPRTRSARFVTLTARDGAFQEVRETDRGASGYAPASCLELLSA